MHTSLKNLLAAAAGVVASTFLFTGCSQKGAHDSSTDHAVDEASARRYPLRGVIVEIDAAKKTLLVQHEEIPGFMGAMTMAFPVDAAVVEKVKVGQTIAATLVHDGGKFWLEDVKDVDSAGGGASPK